MPDSTTTSTDDERWAGCVGSAEIRAAVDRVVPADDWPGGWAGGVGDYLGAAGTDQRWALEPLTRLRDLLGARGFTTLDETEQDAVLTAAGEDPATAGDLAALVRLCWEGYYATERSAASRAPGAGWPAGLSMIGFRDLPEGAEPVEAALPAATPASRIRPHYDVVVVGSGPGGGVAAQVLAQAGRSVLVLERARPARNAELRGDHLHGKRNAVYRSVAGPGPGYPRVAVDDSSGEVRERVVEDDDAWAYGLNADTLGGGTRLWQGMAWRFFPEDFAMESVYGNPEAQRWRTGPSRTTRWSPSTRAPSGSWA